MTSSESGDAAYNVLIGEVVAAHGIRGEVRVALQTDFPERFRGLREVYVRSRSGAGRLMAVRSARLRLDKGQVLLAFEGVADRTVAETLTGSTLWVREDQTVRLQDGEFYEFQIVGLTVKTTDGEVLGQVTEIIHTGTNDVYVTERCLIPAIADVVKRIDLERGEMIVEPVPGLLD